MKYDLADIARNPGSSAEVPIEVNLREVEGMTLTAPVRGRMSVSSTGKVLLLEGSVDTEVEQVCFRCVTIYRQPVHAEFQEDFVMHQVPGGSSLTVEEEDEAPDARLFFPGTMDLNLDELLRQSILLALPVKPLCQDACQGLCAHCGQNLNEGHCNCQDEGINPQMAALQRLLEKRQHD